MVDISSRRGESPTATNIRIGPLTIVVSYETPVAFALSGYGWVVSENIWSRTTGKHITQETPIPKGERVPHAVFERKFEVVMKHLGFAADDAIKALRELDALSPLQTDDPDAVREFLEI